MKKLIALLLALTLSTGGLMVSAFAERKLYLSNSPLEVSEPETEEEAAEEEEAPEESTEEAPAANVNQNPSTGR